MPTAALADGAPEVPGTRMVAHFVFAPNHLHRNDGGHGLDMRHVDPLLFPNIVGALRASFARYASTSVTAPVVKRVPVSEPPQVPPTA